MPLPRTPTRMSVRPSVILKVILMIQISGDEKLHYNSLPFNKVKSLGNRPPVFSNSYSVVHFGLPGVWIAPEIESAIEELFGSTENYAEQNKAVLLRQREMFMSARHLFEYKLKHQVDAY